MSEGRADATCANCGRAHPAADLDGTGWCPSCRKTVIRRATRIGHVVGALLAAAVVAGMVAIAWTPRFFVIWGVLVAAVYFIGFKLARRVAFEVVRSRGVPPAPE